MVCAFGCKLLFAIDTRDIQFASKPLKNNGLFLFVDLDVSRSNREGGTIFLAPQAFKCPPARPFSPRSASGPSVRRAAG